MVRNRNGFWMSPKFFMSPDDGGGVGGAEGAPAGAESGANAGGENAPAGGEDKGNEPDVKTLQAQIEQMKQDMARQKAALDEATSEAGKYRKELRAKQTQEEIDAANKKEEQDKRDREFAELQKKVARAEGTKNVMSRLSVDEDTAGKIAECLIGCEDANNALLLIQKAWDAKEKALRLEFGRIPGPGAGGSNEEDAAEKAAIETAKQMGRKRAESGKSVSEGLKGYIR